ncbi:MULTISPECIES: hypothetical protein [unclassified Micromonospora]|uniref:hypothetical protein n=1 Tax=unclassified Micromonospora TaxID=2617518 RepID=UPI0022CB3AA0|nr:hypothetical protein [Micromonospora sp. AKA38]GHJ15374.1 hypothetical protein TPA0908_33690 [Micromonospora sp. AKA38]
MPITTDDAYLTRAASSNTLISEEVTASPGGDIAGISLKPGHSSFSLGNQVQKAVSGVGANLSARLTEIRDTATNRAAQLTNFMAITNDTEGMNGHQAQEFLANAPAWNTSPTPGK